MSKRNVIIGTGLVAVLAVFGLFLFSFSRSSSVRASPEDFDMLFDVLEIVLRDSEERWEGTLSRDDREAVLEGQSHRHGRLRVSVEVGTHSLTNDRGRARFQNVVAALQNRCGILRVVARRSPEGVSSITVAGFKSTPLPWVKSVAGTASVVKLPDEDQWDSSIRSH